jgi:hypothetical protein
VKRGAQVAEHATAHLEVQRVERDLNELLVRAHDRLKLLRHGRREGQPGRLAGLKHAGQWVIELVLVDKDL